jgi:hypothetical protein
MCSDEIQSRNAQSKTVDVAVIVCPEKTPRCNYVQRLQTGNVERIVHLIDQWHLGFRTCYHRVKFNRAVDHLLSRGIWGFTTAAALGDLRCLLTTLIIRPPVNIKDLKLALHHGEFRRRYTLSYYITTAM